MEEYFEATNLKKEPRQKASKNQDKKLTLVTRRGDVTKTPQN